MILRLRPCGDLLEHAVGCKQQQQHAITAPIMAPIDPTQLSSNWKKLQEQLKKEQPVSRPSLKRKRPDEVKNKPPLKQQKLDSASPTRSKEQMSSSNGDHKLRLSKSVPLLKSSPEHEAPSRPSSNNEFHQGPLTAAEVNEGVSQTALAGKYVGLDCEMVGFGPTPDQDSQLARVSIVNYHGEQLYDTFVRPQVPVTDYRTAITGITAKTLKEARPFKEVQQDVATLLTGRVLVGHALKKDLEVLMLSHPRRDLRDTSRHQAYRALSAGKTPALKKLAKELLGLDIQEGHHSSVEDARTAMLLYRKEKDAFESEHTGKYGRAKRMEAENAGLSTFRRKKKKKAEE